MKEEKRILNVLGQVDDRYIEEAAPGKRAGKKSVWIKLAACAACLALVAALGVGAWQGAWFSGSDIARLNDGDKIDFTKSNSVGGALSLAYEVTTRELNAEEITSLFGDMPFAVEADAIFNKEDNRLIGFDGNIGAVKVIIATSELPLLDTSIEGIEEVSEVDGITVTAGYFLTDKNSRGEQNAIYFATFELGESTYYIENAGAKEEREAVKNELATVLQKLIASGEPDITRF